MYPFRPASYEQDAIARLPDLLHRRDHLLHQGHFGKAGFPEYPYGRADPADVADVDGPTLLCADRALERQEVGQRADAAAPMGVGSGARVAGLLSEQLFRFYRAAIYFGRAGAAHPVPVSQF